MRGEGPGSPEDLCVLSFEKGFHGRTIGSTFIFMNRSICRCSVSLLFNSESEAVEELHFRMIASFWPTMILK